MVKAKVPLRLLLAGHQVYESGGEGGSIKVLELLKHDLCLLTIGRVRTKEVKALPGGGGVLSFRILIKIVFAEPSTFLPLHSSPHLA